jgi:hypothetical protein
MFGRFLCVVKISLPAANDQVAGQRKDVFRAEMCFLKIRCLHGFERSYLTRNVLGSFGDYAPKKWPFGQFHR